MEKPSSQFDFNDFTEVRQAQFDAMILPGELQNQIETDYNELHAMYPFLPVDPPILKSLMITTSTGVATVDVPTSAKLMRIRQGSQQHAYTTAGGTAINDNSEGVGWIIVPPDGTGWIYCGHIQQLSIAALASTGRVSVEFASMHARGKK